MPDLEDPDWAPTEVMKFRVQKILQSTLPDVDLEDYDLQTKRQFAAEYSQSCYVNMLENENNAVGNYLAQENALKITSKQRDAMIVTM